MAYSGTSDTQMHFSSLKATEKKKQRVTGTDGSQDVPTRKKTFKPSPLM